MLAIGGGGNTLEIPRDVVYNSLSDQFLVIYGAKEAGCWNVKALPTTVTGSILDKTGTSGWI